MMTVEDRNCAQHLAMAGNDLFRATVDNAEQLEDWIELAIEDISAAAVLAPAEMKTRILACKARVQKVENKEQAAEVLETVNKLRGEINAA